MKPPIRLLRLFCSAKEMARVTTDASATMPVTSTPRLEAAVSASSTYSTALTRDLMRLWAAFSSLDLDSALLMIVVTIRITIKPTSKISRKGMNRPKAVLAAAFSQFLIISNIVIFSFSVIWGKAAANVSGGQFHW